MDGLKKGERESEKNKAVETIRERERKKLLRIKLKLPPQNISVLYSRPFPVLSFLYISFFFLLSIYPPFYTLTQYSISFVFFLFFFPQYHHSSFRGKKELFLRTQNPNTFTLSPFSDELSILFPFFPRIS